MQFLNRKQVKKLFQNFLLSFVFVFCLVINLINTPKINAEYVYSPVSGTQLAIEKYFIYSSGITCPVVTFDYTVSPGPAIAETATKQEIKSGSDSHVYGQPTISQAQFDHQSAKYYSPQSINPGIGNHANLTVDPVELGEGEAYSKASIVIDFSSVSFSAPGVYRWRIDEGSDPSNTTSVDGKTRYLDVYISQISPDGINQQLRVNGYILHNVANYQPELEDRVSEPVDNNNIDTKARGFISKYHSSTFLLANTTVGNQAAFDKYFRYDVDFTDLAPGTMLYATGDFDQFIPDSAVIMSISLLAQMIQNPTSLQADANGSTHATVYLKKGQMIEFNGVTEGFNVAVTITSPHYDTSGKYIIGDFETVEELEALIASASPEDFITFEGNKIKIDDIEGNIGLVFENKRNGAVSTGIIQAVLPGILLIICGIIGLLIHQKNSV